MSSVQALRLVVVATEWRHSMRRPMCGATTRLPAIACLAGDAVRMIVVNKGWSFDMRFAGDTMVTPTQTHPKLAIVRFVHVAVFALAVVGLCFVNDVMRTLAVAMMATRNMAKNFCDGSFSVRNIILVNT